MCLWLCQQIWFAFTSSRENPPTHAYMQRAASQYHPLFICVASAPQPPSVQYGSCPSSEHVYLSHWRLADYTVRITCTSVLIQFEIKVSLFPFSFPDPWFQFSGFLFRFFSSQPPFEAVVSRTAPVLKPGLFPPWCKWRWRSHGRMTSQWPGRYRCPK